MEHDSIIINLPVTEKDITYSTETIILYLYYKDIEADRPTIQTTAVHELYYQRKNGMSVAAIIFIEPQELVHGINITLTGRNVSVAEIKIYKVMKSPTPETGKLLF